MTAKGGAPGARIARAVRRLQAGRLSVVAFLEEVAPYAVHEVEDLAKIDGGRHARTGVAEAVLAEGKDDDTLAKVVRAAVRHRGRALITRLPPARAKRLERRLRGVKFEFHPRARVAVAHDGRTPRPRNAGKVAILTAGSTDLGVAEEARLAAEEQGCEVRLFGDVGVAGIHRLFPALREVEAQGAHAVIVAAGMDGALPSVVGGLVAVPTIGLPVSSGYGVGGKGKAALMAILQSCAPGVAVVNIDNGYGAGVLAAKIAATAVRGPPKKRHPKRPSASVRRQR